MINNAWVDNNKLVGQIILDVSNVSPNPTLSWVWQFLCLTLEFCHLKTPHWLMPWDSDFFIWLKGTFLQERPSGEEHNKRLQLGNIL
jgi:hypothetical protein